MRTTVLATTLVTALPAFIVAAGDARAQTPTYAACRDAGPDAFASGSTSNLFALPGVATDFVLAAGGQLVERGDGTARFSAFVHRSSQIDRRLWIELELSGEVLPGDPSHPPLGALAPQLLPQAYAPQGPVDLSSFRYFTAGSGSMRGFGAYAGAFASLQLSAPLQVGVGANNRNVLSGLAANLTVQMLSQPLYLTLNPSDEAQLRVTTSDGHTQCATHVDRDDGLSAGPVRQALRVPGLSLDYVFVPAGEWTELADGSAVLAGTMRREDDFEDRWELNLVLQNRVDPGDGTWPPVEGPVLGLLPTAYLAAGGIVDPDSFRYYGTASGTLTGGGSNEGGLIDLQAARPAQVGVGADQGNAFFGLHAELTAAVQSQPLSHTIAVTGPVEVNVNVSTLCILPYPNQTPGLHLVLDNVTDQFGAMTGANLAWVEQMTIGSRTITTGNPRNFANGYLKVVSSSLVEVHPPQALPPGTYTTRVFTRAIAGGFRQLTANLPAAPAVHTSPDRFVGEAQDWFVSHGNLGPTVAAITLSTSPVPSVIPGVVSLGIGANFSDLFTLVVLITDPATGAARFHAPAIPPSVQGATIYWQAALLDPVTGAMPAIVSNVSQTLYQ
ncbi:MAG: hypothetical protein AB7O97_00155 [Planctomycetota bacterium]